MSPVRRAPVLAALLVVILILGGGLSLRDASACGGFFARRQATEAELAKTLPYLTVEQVLVVWDEDTQVEDFVREARFDRTNQSFGFVVPLPSKPEVFPVKKAPFDALRKDFPFDPPPSDLVVGRGGGGFGAGGSKGAAPPPVVVLSEQRIGSFTAFVLMANDRAGFDKWLDDNGFATTPQSSAWLAEYVKLGFFFVAFRYEPTAKGDAGAPDAGMTSETVRIRFKTPLPYYPYREPEHAAGTPTPDKRMLSAWLVTKKPMRGVVQKRSTQTLHRPWAEGMTKTSTREALATTVGELGALLPEGVPTLHVATYRDLKTSREGYGDALFVPATPVTLTPAQIEERRRLLPVLDWRLGEDVDAGLDETPSPTPTGSAPPTAPSASATRSGGCSASGSGSASDALGVAVVAVILAVARRSRRSHAVRTLGVALLFVVLAACKKPAADPVDAGEGGSDASVAAAPERRPRTKADLEKDALAVLEGKVEGVTILGSEQPRGGGSSGLAGLAGIGTTQLRGKVTTSGKTVKPIGNFDRVVASMRGRYRACYQTGLTHDPGLEGKVVIGLKIGAGGEVEEAKVDKNEKITPLVASCVVNVTKRATFDAPGGSGTSGTVELVFQPDL